MNEKSDFLLTSKAQAAFRQASLEVVRVAKRTGTPVIIWKDGRVCEIPSDQLDEFFPEAKSSEPAH